MQKVQTCMVLCEKVTAPHHKWTVVYHPSLLNNAIPDGRHVETTVCNVLFCFLNKDLGPDLLTPAVVQSLFLKSYLDLLKRHSVSFATPLLSRSIFGGWSCGICIYKSCEFSAKTLCPKSLHSVLTLGVVVFYGTTYSYVEKFATKCYNWCLLEWWIHNTRPTYCS